jgi:poly(A) polymerase
VADPAWRELATLPTVWTPPRFRLRAAHFLGRGLAKGPALGAALRAAEEAWIAADFPTDARALEAILDAAAGPATKPILGA